MSDAVLSKTGTNKKRISTCFNRVGLVNCLSAKNWTGLETEITVIDQNRGIHTKKVKHRNNDENKLCNLVASY